MKVGYLPYFLTIKLMKIISSNTKYVRHIGGQNVLAFDRKLSLCNLKICDTMALSKIAWH